MREHADDFLERGLKIAAVFQSPAVSVEGAFSNLSPAFPLLCDPDERLYAAYGCESSLAGYLDPRNLGELARATANGILPGRMEGTKTRLPADFLLDENHIVRVAFYAARIAENIPFEAVDDFLSLAGCGKSGFPGC